jgi:site-specific recombinase XerD
MPTCFAMPAATNWANEGQTRSLQAYLGHRNIPNTTRYTALAPDRFKSF